MLIMSPVTSATSDTAPPPSHSEAVRYGWPLPRRRGAYLTGTVGPDRLGGLDAARGLALLGMMAAHVGFTTCGLTSLSGVLNQAHGRSAVLFAVIAGFSLGIMSGRTRPHTGEDLVRTRLRILVRCALLLVLGTCLAVLGPPVGVILGYYAAWLALALPFLGWRPRSLLVLAAVTAAVGPVIKIGLPVVLDSLGMTAQPFLMDGNIAVISFFITGLYPGALWMAYIFLGLGLSRLDWSRSRSLWRLAAVGALCDVVGYGGGWAASSAADPDGPDPYRLVSPAEPAQCSTGSGRLDPAAGARSGRAGSSVGSDAAGFGAGSTPEPAAGPAPSADPIESAPGDGEGTDAGGGKGAVGASAPFSLKSLATAGPHTDTPFEAVGSGGTAMVAFALLQLLSRRLRRLIAPLAAVGSMSLTVYCGHVLAAWALLTWTDALSSKSNLAWGAMSTGFVAFAMAWFAVFARGPLEHLVHVISVRATRARR